MITLKNLFEIMAQAVQQDNDARIGGKRWFFDYSGHVGNLEIRFFPHGWCKDFPNMHDKLKESANCEHGIASAYYFIASRLNK